MKSFKLILTERTTREFNVQAESLEEAMQASANIASALTDAQDKSEAYPQSIRGRFFDVTAQEFAEDNEPQVIFGTLTPNQAEEKQ